MDIKYIGHSSFFIKSKNARVVTDPFDPKMIGLKYPKQEADILTISHHHQDHDYSAGVGGDLLTLDWPGEFEKQGVRVTGFASFHDKKQGAERGANVLYKIEAENISILHCGDQGFVPDDTFIEQIGSVDILMVPVGGFYTIDAAEAIELIKKVEPSMVIPMHFNRPELNQETFGKLGTVADFGKKMGVDVTPVPKLTLKKEDLGEEMKVVVLDISA